MSTEPETQAESSSAQDPQQGAETTNARTQTRSSPEGNHCQCSASANDMASDLKDIRLFMLSAMKSLDISVPEADAKKIDVANLKPNDTMYDGETVTEFWRPQLPTGEHLNGLCDLFLSVFTDSEVIGFEHNNPKISLLDSNSKPVTLTWTRKGHLKAGNGMDVLDTIRSKWPKRLGQQPRTWDTQSHFKQLFRWELPDRESIRLALWQATYDEDQYPTYLATGGPIILDDVRITRTVRSFPKAKQLVDLYICYNTKGNFHQLSICMGWPDFWSCMV
jgi:hypothetical protein